MSCNAGDNASRRHLQHGHSGLIVTFSVDRIILLLQTSCCPYCIHDFNLDIIVWEPVEFIVLILKE